MRFILLASIREPVYHPTFSPRQNARRGTLLAIEHPVCRSIVGRFVEFSRECRADVPMTPWERGERESRAASGRRVPRTIVGFRGMAEPL